MGHPMKGNHIAKLSQTPGPIIARFERGKTVRFARIERDLQRIEAAPQRQYRPHPTTNALPKNNRLRTPPRGR